MPAVWSWFMNPIIQLLVRPIYYIELICEHHWAIFSGTHLSQKPRDGPEVSSPTLEVFARVGGPDTSKVSAEVMMLGTYSGWVETFKTRLLWVPGLYVFFVYTWTWKKCVIHPYPAYNHNKTHMIITYYIMCIYNHIYIHIYARAKVRVILV